MCWTLKNQYFSPLKRHKPLACGIIELSKNNYTVRRFIPCPVYHIMLKTEMKFASGKGVPEPLLWCINSPCIHCFCTIYDAVCYAAVQYRWQNDLRTVFPPCGRIGWYHFQLIHEDSYRCPYGIRHGILSYHWAAAGKIYIQLCSKTAQIHAKSIGERFHSCLITILWVKVLIFQSTNPIFNVGSLSKLDYFEVIKWIKDVLFFWTE